MSKHADGDVVRCTGCGQWVMAKTTCSVCDTPAILYPKR